MPRKKENFLLNLACNVLIPGLLLSKGGAWLPAIPPRELLVLALAFPVTYFIYDYIRRRVANPISVLGFLGTLAGGAIGLVKIDPLWFAAKEAAFPLAIGISLHVTRRMKRPLVKAFVWNDAVLNTERIETALAERDAKAHAEKLFAKVSGLLSVAFFISTLANFILARWIVSAHPDADAALFNEQLGRFHLVSWPLIILPNIAYLLWLMLRFLKRLGEIAGIPEEELYR